MTVALVGVVLAICLVFMALGLWVVRALFPGGWMKIGPQSPARSAEPAVDEERSTSG